MIIPNLPLQSLYNHTLHLQLLLLSKMPIGETTRGKPLSDGRPKAELRPIKSEEARFTRRRAVLFKMVTELSILFDADVGLMVFGHPPIESIATGAAAGELYGEHAAAAAGRLGEEKRRRKELRRSACMQTWCRN